MFFFPFSGIETGRSALLNVLSHAQTTTTIPATETSSDNSSQNLHSSSSTSSFYQFSKNNNNTPHLQSYVFSSLYLLGVLPVRGYKGMSIVQEAARQAIANRQMRSSPSPIKILISAQRGLTLIFNEMDSIKTPVNTEDNNNQSSSSLSTFNTCYTFALENISFCGHPFRSERYFSFIARKHTLVNSCSSRPGSAASNTTIGSHSSSDADKYACVIMVSKNSTKPISNTIQELFQRMHDEMLERLSVAEEEYFLDN